MESEWTCSQCLQTNQLDEKLCTMCDNPAPVLAKAIADIKEPSPPTLKIRKPVRLVRTSKTRVVVSKRVTSLLRRRFLRSKKIVVLVIAGFVGTGKSTWLNAVLKRLEPRSHMGFEVGQKAETQTEGLWVYPYPLKAMDPRDEGVDFMLMDMEGMGGIKKEDILITSQALNKLYAFGMLLSSVFVIHTHLRPDSGSLQSMKNAFTILKTQRDTFGVEIPQIYLMCRDTERVETKDQNTDFFTLVKTHCQIEEDLSKVLTIMGRAKPPESWLVEPQSRSFDSLKNTQYLKNIEFFLRQVVFQSKKKPPSNQIINSQSFVELCESVGDLINSRDFDKYFKGNMDEQIYSIMLPIKEKYCDLFETQSFELAKIADTHKPDEFNASLDTLRKSLIAEYDREVAKTISLSKDSKVLANFRAQVIVSMKGLLAEAEYLKMQLKIQNTEMQAKIKEIIKNNETKEKERKKAVENLKKTQCNLQEQLRTHKEESEKVITEMKEENERQKNYVAKLQDQLFNLVEEKKNKDKELEAKTDKYIQELLLSKLSKVLSDDDSNTIRNNLVGAVKQLEEEKQENKQISLKKQQKLSEQEYQTGFKYYQEEEYDLAFIHLKVAADANHDEACLLVGKMYLNPPRILYMKRLISSGDNTQTAIEYLRKTKRPEAKEILAKYSVREESPSFNRKPLSAVYQPPQNPRYRNEEKKLELKEATAFFLENLKSCPFVDFESALAEIDIPDIWDMAQACISFYNSGHVKSSPQKSQTSARSTQVHSDRLPVVRRVTEPPLKGQKYPITITKDEFCSIALYTLEWRTQSESLYYLLNAALRKADEEQLQRFAKLMKLIISGMSKLPVWRGTAWRAFRDVSNIASLYKKGNVVTWNGFTSTSKDISVIGNGFFKGSSESTIFNIQVNKGYCISDFSMVSNENEVLLMPSSRFKVVDVLEVSGMLNIVQLEQTDFDQFE